MVPFQVTAVPNDATITRRLKLLYESWHRSWQDARCNLSYPNYLNDLSTELSAEEKLRADLHSILKNLLRPHKVQDTDDGAARTVEEEEAARVKAAQEEAARLKAAEEVAARLKARVKAAEEEAAACGRQPPSFVFTLPEMLQQLASYESEKCLICCKRIPRAERVYSGCCKHWACKECCSNWRTECAQSSRPARCMHCRRISSLLS